MLTIIIAVDICRALTKALPPSKHFEWILEVPVHTKHTISLLFLLLQIILLINLEQSNTASSTVDEKPEVQWNKIT